MADRGMYDSKGNVPYQRDISFKFFPNGSGQPALAPSPLNMFILSIVWVSTGLYRITLADTYRAHIVTGVELNSNSPLAAWAQPGPINNFGTSTLPTIDIQILDNSSSLVNPPGANPNNFVSGVITCCDTNGV